MIEVWAISMVRDEEDIVGSMLQQLVDEGVDGIVVADNGSVDGTRAILNQFAADHSIPVLVLDDPDVAYEQSRKMTALARVAHDNGADWIVPVDADECWYNEGDRLAVYLRSQPNHVRCLYAGLYNHFRTGLDSVDADPFRSMVYRQFDLSPLPKVACRWARDLVIEMGNHNATYAGEHVTLSSTLKIRHFPYRSPEQFIRKARNGGQAYAATDFGPHIGTHWRQYNSLIEMYGEERFIEDVWAKYYHFLSPSDAGLICDPAPYRRWVK